MKGPQQSKTIWFGLALILLDTIPQVQDLLAQYFPQFMQAYGVAIIGVLVVILRVVTSQPIQLGRK